MTYQSKKQYYSSEIKSFEFFILLLKSRIIIEKERKKKAPIISNFTQITNLRKFARVKLYVSKNGEKDEHRHARLDARPSTTETDFDVDIRRLNTHISSLTIFGKFCAKFVVFLR